MSPSERHNELCKVLIGHLGLHTQTMSEAMVVTESFLLGIILLGEKLYNTRPEVTVAMLEEALYRAIARHGQQS